MINASDLRIGNYVKTFITGTKKLLKLTAQDISLIESGKLEVFPVALLPKAVRIITVDGDLNKK